LLWLLDRYRGTLAGLAAGDALGTTLEFKSPGTFKPISGIVGGGPFGLRPGQWTDDTSMALCMAESLVEKHGFDALDQMQRYCRWYRRGHWSSTGHCFDIGNATRAALVRFETSGEPFSGSTAPNTAGNGSLMRLAPVVLWFAARPAEAMEMAGESSRTTHGAAECIESCRVFASLLLAALDGRSKEEILALLPRPLPATVRGTGYVRECLEAAVWAFASSASFEEGALMAVNLGDDADTTGAVYGQIGGAYYGESGIPAAWLSVLWRRDDIRALATRIFQERPGPLP
jgi:ADP-ribosyl-[dinitrogen reductase] hydrolase